MCMVGSTAYAINRVSRGHAAVELVFRSKPSGVAIGLAGILVSVMLGMAGIIVATLLRKG